MVKGILKRRNIRTPTPRNFEVQAASMKVIFFYWCLVILNALKLSYPVIEIRAYHAVAKVFTVVFVSFGKHLTKACSLTLYNVTVILCFSPKERQRVGWCRTFRTRIDISKYHRHAEVCHWIWKYWWSAGPDCSRYKCSYVDLKKHESDRGQCTLRQFIGIASPSRDLSYSFIGRETFMFQSFLSKQPNTYF